QIENLDLDNLDIKEHSTSNTKKEYVALNEYDILLLPYQDLGPTLDTPLLVIEGLVSNCKVIVSNIGSLSNISGNLYFVDNIDCAKDYLDQIEKSSREELKPITYDYSVESFGNQFLETIKKQS
ncbi:MAG: glycosyltransferase, partial [Ignavibacteriae bacterium]|nr:glycosyltransferase [Ignavibacteriota bacterium]